MWRIVLWALLACAFAAMTIGCGVRTLSAQLDSSTHHKALTLPNYVVIMVQENRTVDNLFQTQPGVDTQDFGIDSHHQRVQLTQVELAAHFDCDHSHRAFVQDVLDGFDFEHCGPDPPPNPAFTYVNPSEITQYTALATQYAFADEVLQSNEGPSLPAHIYLIAATSGAPGSNWNIAENGGRHTDAAKVHRPAGCDTIDGDAVSMIDMTQPFPGHEGNPTFPCIDPPTVLNELDGAHISWKYYTPSLDGIWTAPYAIRSLYENDKANVIVPETTILTDIQNGQLAQVSYVIPRSKNSDHPGTGGGGPTWVASVVDALGASQYWNQCAIIVVWDDWGGMFDHVAYRHPISNPVDPYEYGLRVPLLAIGPFAKSNWVDHTPRDFSAIPHFIEDVYGLASLGKLDSQTDDLFSLFNFGGPPRKFIPIPTGSITVKSLISAPPDATPVDSD